MIKETLVAKGRCLQFSVVLCLSTVHVIHTLLEVRTARVKRVGKGGDWAYDDAFMDAASIHLYIQCIG